MKLLLSVAVLLVGLNAMAKNDAQFGCEQAALKIAKAVRSIEMPADAERATFTVVSREVDSDAPFAETYIIEMLVNGQRKMSDQRVVMVGGRTCILAFYDMPGAG
jgi:hypothetical protein